MNRHDTERIAELELIVFSFVISDPSLLETFGITFEDFSDAAYRLIVKDLERDSSQAPASLKAWLKTREVVAGKDNGVRGAIVERLRAFRELQRLEKADPLAARVARFIELSNGDGK